MILFYDWKYPEDHAPLSGIGVWRRSTWYWSSRENLSDYNQATKLYDEGKWWIE